MVFINKYSIIVPVYKVEKYLEQCVESVLSQTYRDYELILVDDGSPDGCPQMCDLYSQRDNRIRVIHKENGGLSDARNAGIDIACSDIIIFLDSDDYWDDINALSEINSVARQTDADVIIWNHKNLFEASGKIVLNPTPPLSALDLKREKGKALRMLIESHHYGASACIKAIKRELFLQHDLHFEKGVVGEDMEWSALLAIYANSFAVCNMSFYVYRQRGGSITKTVSEKTGKDSVKHIISCYKLAQSLDDEDMRDAMTRYAATQYASQFTPLGRIRTSGAFIETLKGYEHLLDYTNTRSAVFVRALKRILGFRAAIKTLWLVNRMRLALRHG